MRNIAILFFSFSFLLLNYNCLAQGKILGLWEVKKVKVGEEEMTPNGKWSEIKADGSFRSGNGWLQNSKGTYTLNKNQILTFSDPLGIEDEFGGFKTTVSKDEMQWSRTEEGMKVVVFLERIGEIPMTTQDYLVGMWELSKVELEKEDGSIEISDLDGKTFLFLRWDRETRKWIDNNRSRGYWHLNAHQPILSLFDDDTRIRWQVVEVNESILTLKGMDEENKGILQSYNRSKHFPSN